MLTRKTPFCPYFLTGQIINTVSIYLASMIYWFLEYKENREDQEDQSIVGSLSHISGTVQLEWRRVHYDNKLELWTIPEC